jgi:hypothetical protein
MRLPGRPRNAVIPVTFGRFLQLGAGLVGLHGQLPRMNRRTARAEAQIPLQMTESALY